MSDFKYWVQGYNEALGEFSTGFKDITDAFNYYSERLKEVKRDGGHVEFIEISAVAFFSKGE